MMWSVDAMVETSLSGNLHCIYTHIIKADQQCFDRSELFNVENDSSAELGKRSLVTITVESATSPTSCRVTSLVELAVCTRAAFQSKIPPCHRPKHVASS